MSLTRFLDFCTQMTLIVLIYADLFQAEAQMYADFFKRFHTEAQRSQRIFDF